MEIYIRNTVPDRTGGAVRGDTSHHASEGNGRSAAAEITAHIAVGNRRGILIISAVQSSDTCRFSRVRRLYGRIGHAASVDQSAIGIFTGNDRGSGKAVRIAHHTGFHNRTFKSQVFDGSPVIRINPIR